MVNVVLGVTGSVAGIKVAELVQLLGDGGAQVRVAASEHGAVFIEQPQHKQALPVYYRDADDYKQNAVQITQRTDVSVKRQRTDVAGSKEPDDEGPIPSHHATSAVPAISYPLGVQKQSREHDSSSTMAHCSDRDTSSQVFKLVLAAPAMNTKMWNHAATSRHLKELEEFGVVVLPPVSKTLACGDVGVGAMASVESIVAATLTHGATERKKAEPCLVIEESA